jgi:hypothetical protein
MRFTDFLRTAVLLFAGAATALAAVAIAGASGDNDTTILYVAVAWWIVCAIGGIWLGRGHRATEGIARLLANARHSPSLPDIEPARTIVNRLWPLLAVMAVAVALAFLVPQVPAIGAGYALGVALAWRKQSRAVAAIEDRDGVRFYVERSAPLKPTQLVRTPWMRRIEPTDERLSAVP